MPYTKMMETIMAADIDRYFDLLAKEPEMTREEQFVMEQRVRGLYCDARGDPVLREKWNAAAKRTGHKERIF